MTAIAVETELEFEGRLRAAPRQPATAWPGRRLIDELDTREDIEAWELHSELVLVCPEVRRCACELLPERNPDAFLTRPREPVLFPAGTAEEAQATASLSAAVFGYTLWRLVETARIALFAVVGVVALALLAEVLH